MIALLGRRLSFTAAGTILDFSKGHESLATTFTSTHQAAQLSFPFLVPSFSRLLHDLSHHMGAWVLLRGGAVP